MKKHILTLGLAALTLASAHAQGTFNPLNGPTSRVEVDLNADGTVDRYASASDGITIGVFIGRPGDEANILVGQLTVGPYDGHLVGMTNLFAPSADGVDTSVGAEISLRYASVDSPSWEPYDSGTKVITLGLVQGPTTVVWGSTPRPNRFSSPILVVPEPSTLALGGLAGVLLLFRLRKSSKQ